MPKGKPEESNHVPKRNFSLRQLPKKRNFLRFCIRVIIILKNFSRSFRAILYQQKQSLIMQHNGENVGWLTILKTTKVWLAILSVFWGSQKFSKMLKNLGRGL